MCSYVASRRHLAFTAEAERQSLAIADRANDPNSDEAAIPRELDTALNDLADEWT